MHIFPIFTLFICYLSCFYNPLLNFLRGVKGPPDLPRVEYQYQPQDVNITEKKVFPVMEQHYQLIISANQGTDNLSKDDAFQTVFLNFYEKWSQSVMFDSLFILREYQQWQELVQIIINVLKLVKEAITVGILQFSGQIAMIFLVLGFIVWRCNDQIFRNVQNPEEDVKIEESSAEEQQEAQFEDSSGNVVQDFVEKNRIIDREAQERLHPTSYIIQIEYKGLIIQQKGDTDHDLSLSKASVNDLEIESQSSGTEQSGNSISVGRITPVVPLGINWETEKYLQTMIPSIGNILCSLQLKSEEYFQAEQQEDEDGSNSEEFLTSQFFSSDETTSDELETMDAKNMEDRFKQEDVGEDSVSEESFVSQNTLSSYKESCDELVTSDEDAEMKQLTTLNNDEMNKDMEMTDNDSCTLDLEDQPNPYPLSNDLVPETVNMDGTVQIVLFTPDGDPYELNCTLMLDA